ncbi:MAG TPA: DinB family protein [Verrucomicrobiae bacterium]|nr:DinB family protein [Verrucomicrobiae bacterium]
MDLLDSLRIMAGYNRWMNEKLYGICAGLSDEERKRDRGAFFRSIHGTFNHLLLTDRGWLTRFNGKPWPFPSLDQELYNDFAELYRERRKTDREIEKFLAGITPESLDAPFSYENYAGEKFNHPLAPAIVHFFNHQTHHRGQVTTLLSQLGIDSGVTDAMVFYREQQTGK